MDGTYLVTFTTTPDPIPLNHPFLLNVVIGDGRDRTVIATGVTLAVDAAMPHHGHGMTTVPRVRPDADGHFTVTGMQLHMAGYWELYFDLTRNGLTERAYLALEL